MLLCLGWCPRSSSRIGPAGIVRPKIAAPLRGTEGSNPASSSRESGANLTFGGELRGRLNAPFVSRPQPIRLPGHAAEMSVSTASPCFPGRCGSKYPPPIVAAAPFSFEGNRRTVSVVLRVRSSKRAGRMTKHILAGVAAFGLLSGVASAQTYPPAPPPIPAPPSVGIPGSTTTTTTVAPTTGHTTTVARAWMRTATRSRRRIPIARASRAALRATR
jgi:hypothetical protein